MPCKRLQPSHHPSANSLTLVVQRREQGWMVQKAVRSKASSPNSLGPKRDWPEVRGEVLRPRTAHYWLLADGSWARVWKQGGIRRKRKLLFLWESGNRTKKHRILLTALFRGKERRCSPPSLRKSKVQHLWVACDRGRFNRLPGQLGAWLGHGGGAALLREARCAGLGVDSAWGGAALEDAGGMPTATGRLRPGPGGSSGQCVTPGQDVLDASVCCCKPAENCWAKPSTVSTEQPPPWKWGRRGSMLCRRRSSLPGWARDGAPGPPLLDHHRGPIAFLRDRAVTFVTRRARSVAMRSSCINPGSVLPSCTCLSALAWWTCRIAMACRAEAAWPAAL